MVIISQIIRTFDLELRIETAYPDAGKRQRKIKVAIPTWETPNEN